MRECVVRMRMPSKDTVCGMVFDLCGVWYCPVMKKLCRQPDNGEIPSWCPIICQLPEGHGRLVEESNAIRLIDKWFDTIGLNPDIMIDGIKSLPTIVPADTAERSEI